MGFIPLNVRHLIHVHKLITFSFIYRQWFTQMRVDFKWSALVVSFWWGVANNWGLTQSLLDAGRGQDFKNVMEVNFPAESGTVTPLPWNVKIHIANLDIAWKSLLFICSLQKHWFNLSWIFTNCAAVQGCLKSRVIPQSPPAAAQGSEMQHKVLKCRRKLLNSLLKPVFRE